MCLFDEFAFAALSGCTMGYSKCSEKIGGFLWFSDLSDLLVPSHEYFLETCDTSSTAQGGGGSFKNFSKPAGEFGCCESGMAKQIH